MWRTVEVHVPDHVEHLADDDERVAHHVVHLQDDLHVQGTRDGSGRRRCRDPSAAAAAAGGSGCGRPPCGRRLLPHGLTQCPVPDLSVEVVGSGGREVPRASSVLAQLASRVVGRGVLEVPVALRAVDDVNDIRHAARSATGMWHLADEEELP